MDYFDDTCTYEKCLKCEHIGCWAGEIAIEFGEDRFAHFVNSFKDYCFLQAFKYFAFSLFRCVYSGDLSMEEFNEILLKHTEVKHDLFVKEAD